MSTKTPNYQLNQWEPTDQFVRTDFNEDNAKIDAALSVERSAREAADAALRASLEAQGATIPKIKAGTYTGDGAASRFISVGFAPKAVIVWPYWGIISSGILAAGGLAVAGSPLYAGNTNNAVIAISGNGFWVYYTYRTDGVSQYTNNEGKLYHYLAIG